MRKPKNISEEEVTEEVKRVVTKFFDAMKKLLVKEGNTPYKIAIACHKDPGTFNKMLDDCDNCEAKSMIQPLMPYGYSIDVKIVRLKK